MAIVIRTSPTPAVHSATLNFYVTGLTAGDSVSCNDYQLAFADTPTTGTVDANGEFAYAITANSTLGEYVMTVTDTTVGQIVAVTTFTLT